MFFTARNIIALASAVFLLSGGSYLVWSVLTRRSSPSLGSRIIFLTVDFISLSAFVADGGRDFISVVVLLASILSTTAVALSIIRRDGFVFSLQRFELYYLMGAAAILVFWLATNDAFIAF